MNSPILIAPNLPHPPFAVDELPAIAKLARMAHHKYRKRWTKRLGKKPARLLYDVAHSALKMGGRGTVRLNTSEGIKQTTFDARRTHFGSLYFGHDMGGYEPDVSALLASLLKGDRTFFDIGANWGYFSFYAASLTDYSGPIHSFEPAPATRRDLEGLIDGFGLKDRITVHATALSAEAGTATMAIHESETGLNRIAGSGLGREGELRVDVPLTPLDDISPSPDVIKMDVEDHEFEALSGGVATLRDAKPHIVVENWLSPQKPQVTLRALKLLEDSGYQLYQPCWQINGAEGAAIFPDLGDRLPGSDCRLALVPFQSDQRFMLSQQMNVFACHTQRIADLLDGGFDTRVNGS